MINISSDIVTTIMTAVAGMIQQLWVIFALIMAVVVAFFVIRKIIFFFTLAKR